MKNSLKNGLFPVLLGITLPLQAQKIDSLQNQLQTAKPDTHRVSMLHDLSYAYWLGGDDSLAIRYGTQSVNLAKKLGFLPGEGKARLHLTRIEADRMIDLTGAFAQLDTVLRIAAKLKDRHMEAETYIRKAQLLETNLARQPEIMPLYDQAKAIFVNLGDKSWQGTVFNEKARFFTRSGDFSKAVEFLLKARQLQEEVNDLRALRSTLPNLGVAYSALGLYREALRAFDDAEIVAKKRNDKVLTAFLLNQRAEIFEKQGNYAAALKTLTQAADIHKTTRTAYWLPKTYSRMGRVYIQLKDYGNALKYTQLGDKLFQDVVDSDNFLDHVVQLNYAKIALARKQYRRVIDYASKGVEWAEESDPPLLPEAAEYHRLLAESYEMTGQIDQAYVHYKKFKAESDSLLNKESLQKATAATLNYEFDKQQQQQKLSIQKLENENLAQTRNLLGALLLLGAGILSFVFWNNRRLRTRNEELARKNAEIEAALYRGQTMERKRVASELHDNVATRVSALKWRYEAFDTSQFDADQQTEHARLLEHIGEIYDDIRSVSHNLMPDVLEKSGLQAALIKMADTLNVQNRTRFQLELEQSGADVRGKTAYELYAITLELVNNILKHAKARQANIALVRQDGFLTLVVQDDGQGFRQAGRSNGIGLQNIQSRLDRLGGSCQISNREQSGTLVQVRVPIAG
ncbi:tetratricopeptide repeat-containing sensor histidine kinase [Larkinella terrae]|uniref:tetratricopeptide repeat-containing sensor histidine kinase n=1 Tax=Larkinella terrae TaxID=2025311 RepID=UPI00197D7EE5|nr:tetratricopeptide repeat protein [Larkinella terrae]